jgi:hypothetical protein
MGMNIMRKSKRQKRFKNRCMFAIVQGRPLKPLKRLRHFEHTATFVGATLWQLCSSTVLNGLLLISGGGGGGGKKNTLL